MLKITHFCNSFISVESKNSLLVCDPWIGKTTDNAWYSYPIKNKKMISKDIFNSNYIYISHLHCDHLDFKTLNFFNKKKVTIIIKKFNNGILKRRLFNFGFKKILELSEFKKIKINRDFTVSIIPQIISNSSDLPDQINYDLDTSIIIQSNHDKSIFYNNVDNSLNKKTIIKINNFVEANFKKKIDIFTCPLGAASEFPQAFLNIDRSKESKKIIKKSLKDLKNYLKIISPKFFFPSGGTYLIYGKYNLLNKYIAQPQFKQIIENVKTNSTKIINLEGGNNISCSKNDIKFDNKNFVGNNKYKIKFLKEIKKIKYYYDKKINFDLNKLDDIFYKSVKNYHEIIKIKKIKDSWKINFHIYKHMYLNNYGKIDEKKSYYFKKYQLLNNVHKNENKDKIKYLNCYLEYKLFYFLLTKKFPWNTSISGSTIMFKRFPNKFIPTMVFSLNFLKI